MRKLYIRSLICGYGVGILFFTIAPLGLGSRVIEVLKPFLTPGISLTQLLFASGGGVLAFAIALILNGAIFTLLFLLLFLARRNRSS